MEGRSNISLCYFTEFATKSFRYYNTIETPSFMGWEGGQQYQLDHRFFPTSTSYLRNFDTPYSILVSKQISCTFCKIVSTKIYVKVEEKKQQCTLSE